MSPIGVFQEVKRPGRQTLEVPKSYRSSDRLAGHTAYSDAEIHQRKHAVEETTLESD